MSVEVNEELQTYRLETLMNQRLLKSLYNPNFKQNDKGFLPKENREIWMKERICLIKENILLNNLNIKFMKNYSNANIDYFKSYFKASEDFNSVNFDHLQKMRSNFLSKYLKSSKSDQSNQQTYCGDNLKLLENLLNLEINTVSDNNKIISIITSLCSILYSDVIDYEILLRFMNNILSEIAKIDKKINLTYDVIIHIEKNLMFVFDVVEDKILNKEEIKDRLKASLLNKFLYVSMELESISLYLKSIYTIRQFSYVIENKNIVNKFFKKFSKSFISVPNKKLCFKMISYTSSTIFKFFDFCGDKKYIYLTIANKGIFAIGTGYLGTLLNTIYHQYLDASLPPCQIITSKKGLYLINSTFKQINLFQYDKQSLVKINEMKIETNNIVLSIISADNFFYIFEKSEVLRILENINEKVKDIFVRKIDPFQKEKQTKVIFKNDQSRLLLLEILKNNLPYLYFDKKIAFLDYKTNKQFTFSLSVDSLNLFKVKVDLLKESDLIKSSNIHYSKNLNVIITSFHNKKNVIFKLCYNTLSSPFSSLQIYTKVFKGENLIIERASRKKNPKSNEVKCLLTSKENEVIFFINMEESNKYFLSLLSYLVKVILRKGDSSINYIKYVNKSEYGTVLRNLLKKGFHNEINNNLINFLHKVSISSYLINKQINLSYLKEVYSNIIIIRNFVMILKECSIDFEIYEDNDGFNFNVLTNFLLSFMESKNFDKFEDNQKIDYKRLKILKEEIISESLKTLNIIIANLGNAKIKLTDMLFEFIEKNSTNTKLSIQILSIIQSNSSILGNEDNLNKFTNSVIKMESLILKDLNEDTIYFLQNQHLLIFNEKFKELFIQYYLTKLEGWKYYEIDDPITIIFKKLLDYIIEIINSYLKEENFHYFKTILIQNKKNKNFYINYIDNHSIIFQLTLLFVQLVIKNENQFKDLPFVYLSIIFDVILKLDEFYVKVLSFHNLETKNENLINEEKFYIFDTEHPCENDTKRKVNFRFFDNKIYSQFDCLSFMNDESNIHIEINDKDSKNSKINLTYSNNFPLNTSNLSYQENIVLNYNPIAKTNAESYGFKLKLSNFQERYGILTNNDIMTDIRRSLIYSIYKIIYRLNVSEDKNKEASKEIFLYKSFFNSKLLENIFLENLTVDNRNKIFDKLSENFNEEIQKRLNDLFFESKSPNENYLDKKIDDTLNLIILNQDRFFTKTLGFLQKTICMKYVWGNIGGNEVERLVIYVFCILIKHQNIVNRFIDLVNQINSLNEEGVKIEDIYKIKDFNLFLNMWTESSKLRIWFNEKKMLLAENIESKKQQKRNNDEQNIKDENWSSIKEIDEEISKLILILLKKAEFIIKIISPRENSQINTDSIQPGDQLVFNDICQNIFIYLKTDEINLEKIYLKISSQNDKSIKIEFCLTAINLLLYLVNNEQDLKDIMNWINNIFRKKKRIISFEEDLYGADCRLIHKVKQQTQIYIKILIEKCLKENLSINTYVTLIQSLVLKIKGKDFEILNKVKFFDLFERNQSTLSKLLFFKDKTNIHTKNYHCYGKECYDLYYLQKTFFELFQIYSLQIVNKINQYKIENNYHKGKLLFILASNSLFDFSRQISFTDQNETRTILIVILQIITNEIKFYLEENLRLINHPIETIIYNEEKINNYFILLYRLLKNNNHLNTLLITHFSEFVNSIFEVFLICSVRNKTILLKLIYSLFVQYEANNVDNIITCLSGGLRKILLERYPIIHNLISKEFNIEVGYDPNIYNKESDIKYFVHYLFYLVLLFRYGSAEIQWRSDSDYEISLEIIDLIRSLLSTPTFKGEIINFIKNTLEKHNENLRIIVLTMLGADLNIIKVGTTVDLRPRIDCENSNEFYNINEYHNAKSKSFLKKGSVLGFTNNPKNPLVIDDLSTHFFFQQQSYNPRNKFAIIVLADNISKESIKKSSCEFLLYETKSLIPGEEEKIHNNDSIVSTIKETNLLKICLNEVIESNLHDQKKFYCLKLFHRIITSPSKIKEDFLRLLNDNHNLEKFINCLQELCLVNLNSLYKFQPLEFLEKILINELVSHDLSSNRIGYTIALSFENNLIYLENNTSLFKEIKFFNIFTVEKEEAYHNIYLNLIKLENVETNFLDKVIILVEDLSLLLTDNIFNLVNNFTNCIIIINEKIINDGDFQIKFNVEKIKFDIICLSSFDYAYLNQLVSEKKTYLSNKNKKSINEDLFAKLCSHISRRIILKLYIEFSDYCREKIDVDKLIKIFKLLINENTILTLNNCTYYELQNDICSFLKKLDKNIEFENIIIKQLINLEFLNRLKYDDSTTLIDNLIEEQEILQLEIFENNLKIIFALLKNDSIDKRNITEFVMKLFYALIRRLNDFHNKSIVIVEFIIDFLTILLNKINDLTQNKDENIVKTISSYTFFFNSKDFTNLINKINVNIFEISSITDNSNITIESVDSKLMMFFIFFIDFAFNIFIEYHIDLNIKFFFEHKIFTLYYSYCLLTKNFKSLNFFILFCEKHDYIQVTNESMIKIDINYTSTLPHLRKFSFPDYDMTYVRLRNISYNWDESVFLYSDKNCNNLQDYFSNEDEEKEIIIKNQFDNCFYLSTPYSNYKHVLYASGSNENHSLGCGLELDKIYGTPQKVLGIECDYINEFMYGRYYCFVLTMDGKLYVCGKDIGSTLKIEASPIFTPENYFNDIGKKEGIDNIYVNNFSSSIMLTKSNKLFAAGINTDGLLSRTIRNSAKVPVEMKPLPKIKIKVKSVSCGLKSSLIILEDGSAYALGCNDYYETTNRATIERQYEYFKFNLPENHKVIRAVAGEYYFLILIEEPNNKVRLFSVGLYEEGSTGVEHDSSCSLQKCVGVENLEFKVISARNRSSAAISRDGKLFTFGINSCGNLGLGHKINIKTPTLVETFREFVVDQVCIAHNNMLVIARNLNGEKKLYSCGLNTWGTLCFDDLSRIVDKPEEIDFFKQLNAIPIKISNSNFQSFILTLDSKIKSEKSDFQISCQNCQKPIFDLLFFYRKQNQQIIQKLPLINEEDDKEIHRRNLKIYQENKSIIVKEQSKVLKVEKLMLIEDKIFICENCVDKHEEIMFLSNLPSQNLFKIILPIPTDIMKLAVNEEIEEISPSANKLKYDYRCSECLLIIENIVNISTENHELILCINCIKDHSNKIEFPQLFYSFNSSKIRLNYNQKNNLPNLVFSSSVYGVLKNFAYSMEVILNHSFLNKLKLLNKSSTLHLLYKKWCKLNDDMLIAVKELKEEFYDLKKDHHSPLSIYTLFDMLKKIDPNKYQCLRNLDEESFKMLYNASTSINFRIFELMTLINHMKEKGNPIIIAVTQNLNLVSSSVRIKVFQERLEKIKVNVNPSEEINLSRIKSNKFYEKNIVDINGDFTIFGQLFNKMKKFPIINYRSKRDNRLFLVKLSGEGATDYGGPYREILSIANDELQSSYLDLFIKSPNNRNEIGNFRDKYIINPGAKSALQFEMYVFLGYLMGYAICSGNLLNLTLHPVIWKLILNQAIDFSEYETIDKLFYKLINDIEKNRVNTIKDLEAIYDLNYTIQLSDGTDFELIPGGKNIQVLPVNLHKFIDLAKKNRICEFKIQIEALRLGLIVIPEPILSMISWKELEDLSCGKQTINIKLLKQRTEYKTYLFNDKSIIDFWTILDSFTNQEKVLYLKYVWGRSRLPDPERFPFTHKISKLFHSSPDIRFPSAITCNFALMLPEYSNIEIMRKKLKYVIYNCSEIDTDFDVTINTTDI